MSTIKVNKIENTATSNGGVEIDNTGHVKLDGVQLPTAGPLSNRNLIINGAMQVAQRATSHTITSNVYTLDRYQAIGSGGFSWDSATVSQDSDAPDGFNNSLRVDVNTTQTPSGGGNALIRYEMEAQDLQRLAFGSSEAKTFTVSFWVKSDKTGTYCLQIVQDDASKYQLKEYTVSNSWTRQEITFEANTADSIADDTGRGFDFRWHLATGSDDHHSATTSWTSGNTYRATSNQVNLFDNASNNFRITGIQVESGDKATPFEHRSYGDDLARCQRYYYYHCGEAQNSSSDVSIALVQYYSADTANAVIHFPVVMRARPTIDQNTGTDMYRIYRSGGNETFSSLTFDSVATPNNGTCAVVSATGLSGASAGNVGMLQTMASNAFVGFDAEL